VYSIDILSFCYIIVYNKMTLSFHSADYYNYILDDSDGDSDIDINGDFDGDNEGAGGGAGSILDTKWIADLEEELLLSEYDTFIKKDIDRVSFQFVYLDRDKKTVQYTLPVLRPYEYMLKQSNQITQGELLHIIHRYQFVKNKKKYYNFHSLLLYDFQMPESNNSNNDVRWLSEYVSTVSSNHDDYSRITEYTNLLSFDVIYFRPLISMFHDLIEFTVILYED
jgi:hypothetical protein